jgi:chorismate synthase
VTSTRTERDEPCIVSGVFEGRTTGAPVCVLFESTDARSRDYDALRDLYRPGHADFTYDAKYGHRDHRGGGRASARETVARVAAGAVAKKILAIDGIRIVGYARRIGEVEARIDPETVRPEDVERSAVRCPDADVAARMESLVAAVRADGDSIGGIAELVARGVPPGLGEPVFDKLEADLAKAMLSVPAVTGFEYGSGFGSSTMRGSEHNDAFTRTSDGRVRATTNRHGGILGGISSGSSIVVRAALKPPSSIPIEQQTVTRAGEETTVRVGGRHDPCLVPRFVPVGEAMMALVLVDHLLRARSSRLTRE